MPVVDDERGRAVLYDPAVLMDARREWVRAWSPAVPGISEVFHARFVEHRYPPHTHDDWTLFVVDEGAIRYDLDARDRGVGTDVVTLLPPHVIHDGRAASDRGFRKRVLYVGVDVLPAHLSGRAVDDPDIRDPALLAAIGRLHGLLEDDDDALAAEEMTWSVGDRIRALLRDRSPAMTAPGGDAELAEALRDLLDAQRAEAMTLAAAGAILGADVSALIRAFRRTFAITPHRYLIGRRIDAARKRLLDGEPASRVACDVGFHDQAHFTRHFKRHVGATPARFARSARP
jgi:AraC-like DNA-binding protein